MLSICCLQKISSSSTSSGSQIATLKRSLTWTNIKTWTVVFFTVVGKNVCLTAGNSSSSPVQHDCSPHRHSLSSDLTSRLYATTSLKSVSLKGQRGPYKKRQTHRKEDRGETPTIRGETSSEWAKCPDGKTSRWRNVQWRGETSCYCPFFTSNRNANTKINPYFSLKSGVVCLLLNTTPETSMR